MSQMKMLEGQIQHTVDQRLTALHNTGKHFGQVKSPEQRPCLSYETKVLYTRFCSQKKLSLCFRFQTFSPLTCKTKISLLISNNSNTTNKVKQIKGTTPVSCYMSMAPNFMAAFLIGKISTSSYQHRWAKSPFTDIPCYFCNGYLCSPYRERVIASLWRCLYVLCKIETGSLMGLVRD